jgi:hypothetical protein
VRERGPECCSIIMSFFSLVSFTFFGTFFFFWFSFSVLTQSVFCTVFSLDMVSYRNYLSTQSGPVSIEAPGSKVFVSLPAYTRNTSTKI